MVSTRILKGAFVRIVFSDGSSFRKEFLGTSTGRAKAMTWAKKQMLIMGKGSDIESVSVENIWSEPGETVSIEMGK